MQTQNNPKYATGLLWVIFLAKFNPKQPKTTQRNAKLKNQQILQHFCSDLQKWDASGLLWQKKEKKKEAKKKINKNTGCWIKDFGFWIEV